MKLSTIVAYKNLLDGFNLDSIHYQARHLMDGVIHRVINHELQFNNYSQELVKEGHDVDRAFADFKQTFTIIGGHVNNLIAEQHGAYLKESTRLYNHEMCFDSNDYILNRKLELDPASYELLQGRIGRYADWRWPGAIFRPATETFIDQLVSMDPLYVIDHNEELIRPAISKFHPQYQRRVRQYVLPETPGRPVLDQLPNNQFGYMFAYNFFNYKPLEVVNQYISEIWDKLRPGGGVFMTINDCDYAHGVALTEASFMLYTPGHMIIEHAANLGFELAHRHRGEGNVAWLEFKKPGTLSSIRGGQTLAKICPL